MFKLLAASLLFLLQGAVGSPPDPNALAVPAPFVAGDPNPNYFPDWNNPNGKEQVDCAPQPGDIRETWVFINQSNGTNVVPTLYTPSNRLGVQNFNISDGGCYRAKVGGAIDPMLGCTGYAPNLPSAWPNGNWMGILADLRITAGKATREVMVPIGVGGSYIHDWEPGGSSNIRIGVTARRMAAAGLVPSGVLIGQGESDLNTPGAAYQASLQNTINDIRSHWPTVPIYVARETYVRGMTSAPVRAAQIAVVNPSIGIFQGPDGDARTGIYRQSDDLHWSTAGASIWASDWNAVLP